MQDNLVLQTGATFTSLNTMPDSSITIRLSARQREALRRKAAAMITKESTWVRDLIERDIGEELLGEKLKGLAGSVDSGTAREANAHPLARQIVERNRRK